MNSVPGDTRHLWTRRRARDGNSGSYKCGEATKRQLTMVNCTKDCERNYFLYLPSVVCSGGAGAGAGGIDTDYNNDTTQVGTLPLVFAVHCLGCTPATMMHWTDVAETYNFVLAIPEGLKNSFNGQHCCGYALEQELDDVGFLQNIIHELDQEFSFLSSNLAYAMGWSNGGYLVSFAARLFQAIAPISGYQVDINVEQPTAVFLHHARDDHNVRIAGCCTNSSMARCCCRLSTFIDTCTSAENKMNEWSSPQINGCESTISSNNSTPEQERQHATPEITIDKPGSVTCYTYPNCKANTTYCIHEHKGHFNQPSFQAAFPMTTEIADFFARHACQSNGGGIWSPKVIVGDDEEPSVSQTASCSCQESRQGIYCRFSAIENNEIDYNDKQSLHATVSAAEQDETESALVIVGLPVLMIAIGMVVYYSFFLRRQRYKGFDKVSTVELRRM